MGLIIVLVITLVVATIIVNAAQQLYMRLIGANAMFFNGRKKLIAIVVVGMTLAGAVCKFLGIT